MTKLWTFLLMGAISAARIGMGLFNGISGPTMLYLAENVDSSIYQLSFMFLGRSIGVLLGAILGGIVKDRTDKKFRHLLLLGAGVCFLGVSTLVVPWIRRLWFLCIDLAMGGVMFGYLDAGLQALILAVWGEQGSRGHIQLFHFTYCVGALIAPLMARPFLVMADTNEPAKKSCPSGHESLLATTEPYPQNYTSISRTSSYENFSALEENAINGYNPVGFAYVISSLWMMLVGAAIIFLSVFDTESKAMSTAQKKGFTPEKRAEEPLRNVIWVFLPLIGYYFCGVTTENVYYNYIYAVSLCSDLKFSVTDSSYMTSLNWLGLAFGRLVGVAAAGYLKPRTIIIWSIVGSIIDSAIMCLFGEQTFWLAWTISFVHGFTPSMMYPSGVSWLSQITNVTGFYMFIFTIGAYVGVLTMLPLAGYIFDTNPFSVMYQVFVLAAVNAFFFGLALFAAKRHKAKRGFTNTTDDKEQMTIKEAKPMVEFSSVQGETAKCEEQAL